jgi:hypothetical protein
MAIIKTSLKNVLEDATKNYSTLFFSSSKPVSRFRWAFTERLPKL